MQLEISVWYFSAMHDFLLKAMKPTFAMVDLNLLNKLKEQNESH